MLNFENCANVLKEYVENKLNQAYPNIKIEFGKYGQLPAQTPVVLIYCEPMGEISRAAFSYIYERKMRVNFFICESDNEPHYAILKANEITELLEKALYDFETYANNSPLNINNKPTQIEFVDKPISFDGYYSDLAVINLECLISYAPFFEST